MYIQVCLCTYIRIHTHTHTHTHLYKHTHRSTHTHTHTHMNFETHTGRQTSHAHIQPKGSKGKSRRDAVLLLGAMACRLAPPVTEHVQALLMEGLQSLPPLLHELLLEQLAHIALVPPHVHYRTVVDLMFARYSRPFDRGLNGPREPLLRRDLPACLLLLAQNLASSELVADLSKRLLALFIQIAISGQLERGRPPPLSAKSARGTSRSSSSMHFKSDLVQILAGILPALACALDRASSVFPVSVAGHDEAEDRGRDSGSGASKVPGATSHGAHDFSPSPSSTNPQPLSPERALPTSPTSPSLMSRGSQTKMARASSTRLIRSVWFYIALLGLVQDGGGSHEGDEGQSRDQWRVRWNVSAKRLARASPVLAIAHSHSLLPIALELNDIVTKGLSDLDQAAVRVTLAESLAPKYRDIVLKERSSTSGRGLTVAQVRYVYIYTYTYVCIYVHI